jgi:hypothetical protein
MKLTTATAVLEKDAKFLGMTFLGYLKFVKANPLAQPQKTIDAYKVFTAEAAKFLA